MSIPNRQNCPEALQQLEATSFLYHCAKWVRNLGFFQVILVGSLMFAVFAAKNDAFSEVVTFGAMLTWLIDQIVLKTQECRLKKEAAIIQEEFDCFVLDLPWPEYKGVSHPTPDRIKHLASKARNVPKIVDKLKDWYTPDAIPSDPDQARVHCQRINCWWDVSLRRKWKTFLRVIVWSFVAATILVAIVTGITVAELTALAASNFRLLAWGSSEIGEQSAAIDQIDGIHRYVSSLSSEERISPTVCRQIQDEIFEHRCFNPPVPNWFYRLNRDKQELEAGKPEN